MSSGFRHWCAWFAAEALGLLALILIPMPWLMFVIVAIALLGPFVGLAIWHWWKPRDSHASRIAKGANPKNQKGALTEYKH